MQSVKSRPGNGASCLHTKKVQFFCGKTPSLWAAVKIVFSPRHMPGFRREGKGERKWEGRKKNEEVSEGECQWTITTSKYALYSYLSRKSTGGDMSLCFSIQKARFHAAYSQDYFPSKEESYGRYQYYAKENYTREKTSRNNPRFHWKICNCVKNLKYWKK